MKSRVSAQILTEIILNDQDYFRIAEEYTELKRKFNPSGYYNIISLWVEMIISPIVSFVMMIIHQEPPGIMNMLSLHKSISLWQDWFEYQNLKHRVHRWMNIVRSIGGPFIATNDPSYQAYVYADNMQRIYYSFFPKN